MRISSAVLLVALSLLAASARASIGLVPAEFATIQAALDAPRDTVYVGFGTYEESVNITHPVLLSWRSSDYAPFVPRVRRLSSTASVAGDISVQGIHFLGGASASVGMGTCTFDKCRADSGLSCTSLMSARVSGCIVFGNLSVRGFVAQSFMNTVAGGTLSGDGEGTSPFDCNYVTGPATVGITTGDDDYVVDNLVRNCVDGIRAGCGSNVGVSYNVVEDCSANGIVGPGTLPCPTTNGAGYMSNTVRRCGVSGIVLTGVGIWVDGNSVDSTGSHGMVLNVTTNHADNNRVTRARGNGISGGIFEDHVRGNVATHCLGDGISITEATRIDHNVAGGNGGRGIAVAGDRGNTTLRSNTSYDNAGPGFEILTSDALLDSVSYNIGYGNGVGLRRNGAGAVVLACNDWFANSGGATSGIAVGANDVALDPRFCNRPAGDVTLAQPSPLLNLPGCGLVGALALGCAAPVGVEWNGAVGARLLLAYPEPSRGLVRFAWPASSEATRLEIYDAQGALRWSTDVPAASSGFTWRLKDIPGRALQPGVYFARLSGRAGLGACRLTIVN
jgi:hypothetical protein